MNYEEIKQYWNNEFYHYSVEYLDQFGFKPETAAFLSSVGLMCGKKYTQKSQFRYLEKFEKQVFDHKTYIKIAKEGNTAGLFLEEGTDHVHFIVFFRNISEQKTFCNSKLSDFITFQTLNRQKMSPYTGHFSDGLEGYECARTLVEKFKEMDPASLYFGSYWGGVLYGYAEEYFYDIEEKLKEAMARGKYKKEVHAEFDALFNGIEVWDK